MRRRKVPFFTAAAFAFSTLWALPAAAGCFNAPECPELRGLSSVGVVVALSRTTARDLLIKKDDLRNLAAATLKSNLPGVRISEAGASPHIYIRVKGLRNVYMGGDFTGDAQAMISIKLRQLTSYRRGVRVPMVLWADSTFMSGPSGSIGANLRSALVRHLADLAADWRRANGDHPPGRGEAVKPSP